jgi:hypothetical protein
MSQTLLARLGESTRRLLRPATLLLGMAGLLVGLVVAGRWAREQNLQRDRYRVDFAAIACDAPPGATRGDFLTEVQYLGSLPDRLPLLDEGLPARLAEAFARHPWFEKVERVEVRPPREIQARLVFRKPVLVVAPFNRAVDRHGVLLPATAPTEGLPVLTRPGAPPAGVAGTPWGDEEIEASARRLSGTAP